MCNNSGNCSFIEMPLQLAYFGLNVNHERAMDPTVKRVTLLSLVVTIFTISMNKLPLFKDDTDKKSIINQVFKCS